MKATDVLKHEHRIIERMLEVLEKACGKLERGEEVSVSLFKEGVTFVRVFADQRYPAVGTRKCFRQATGSGQ